MQNDWLKTRMEARGLNDEALGRTLNLERSTANRVMNGARLLYLDEIERVARFLDVSVLEVIYGAWGWTDPEFVALAQAWLLKPREPTPSAPAAQITKLKPKPQRSTPRVAKRG
jgi:transcriptional regulator with XRE-family HTH domain